MNKDIESRNSAIGQIIKTVCVARAKSARAGKALPVYPAWLVQAAKDKGIKLKD